MIEWTYRLEFESPFSIFSGLSVAGLVDRMVERNSDGFPVVPGSTVKGRWRFFAERILYARNNSTSGDLYIHSPDGPACKQEDNPCTICKWFGSPSVPAALQVGPANLSVDPPNDWPAIFKALHDASHRVLLRPDAEIRPGVALSRQFRIAQADHLFFDEVVPPVSFEGKIRLFKEPDKKMKEDQFLRGTASLVDALGGRKAVGRGRLTNGIHIVGGAV